MMRIAGRRLSTSPSEMPFARFLDERFGVGPHTERATASAIAELLDWNVMGRVLAAPSDVDVLVVGFGRLWDKPRPRSTDGLRHLMDRAYGIVARRAEHGDPALAELASAFERELGGVASVQLSATPGGTHGLGWHYDDEHVFVVQATGTKTYFLRPNTVAGHLSAGMQSGFGAIARETSRVREARLEPGDWLYIPSRWWHVAVCEEDALSLAVCVTMPSVHACPPRGLRHHATHERRASFLAIDP